MYLIEDKIREDMSFDEIQNITGGEILDFDIELAAYEIINFNFQLDPAYRKLYFKIKEDKLKSVLFQTSLHSVENNLCTKLKEIFTQMLNNLRRRFQDNIDYELPSNFDEDDVSFLEKLKENPFKINIAEKNGEDRKYSLSIVLDNSTGCNGYVLLERDYDDVDAVIENNQKVDNNEDYIDNFVSTENEEALENFDKVEYKLELEKETERAGIDHNQCSRKIKSNYLNYGNLPKFGGLLSIVCVLGFSWRPFWMSIRAGSLMNFFYFVFSTFFYAAAFYIPYHVFKKFKIFVEAEPEEINLFDGKNGTNADIHKVWGTYKATFFSKEVSLLEHKTRANADLYFNFDSITATLSKRYPVGKAFKLIGGSFIGLGILGTFIGFSSAMVNLNLDSPDTMMTGIKTLINVGLSTAFNTSITGVFCSLIYTFMIYTPVLQNINLYFEELCDELDTEYYVSETEALMKYTMIVDENEKNVTFSDSLKLILDNMKKQSDALVQFNNDLADQISNIQTTVDTSMTHISTNVSGELKDVVLGGIHQELGGLQTALITVTGDLNKASDSISETVNTINNDVGDSIQSFNESLIKSLSDSKLASEHLSLVPEKMQNISFSLDTAGDKMAAVSDTISKNMSEVGNGFSILLDDIKEVQINVSTILQKAITNEEYSGKNLTELVTETNSVLEGFKNIDKNVSHIFEKITEQISLYTSNTTGTLSNYLNEFASSSSSFSSTISGSVGELEDTLMTFDKTLNQINTKSESFSNSVKHLEKVLKNENK